MAKGILWLAAVLVACASAPAFALDDADLLFCAQVQAETAGILDQPGRSAKDRREGKEAHKRSVSLSEREYDLLNDFPQRHSRASVEAKRRLAALPAGPSVIRNVVLRAAAEECRQIDQPVKSVAKPGARAAGAPVASVAVTSGVSVTGTPDTRATASPGERQTAPARGLDDAGILYCAQIHAETAKVLEQPGSSATTRQMAKEAHERSVALGEREYDLLNDFPQRHSRASVEAKRRLAALPSGSKAARSLALRAAFEECRDREEGRQSAPAAAAMPGERVEMLGKRRFCRDLMQRTAQRSVGLLQEFSDSELEALDELQRIAGVLAKPLPGQPVTPEEDRQANRFLAQRRAELDREVAAWKSGPGDPMVAALSQCHDDYAQGLLGAPEMVVAPAATAGRPAGPAAVGSAAAATAAAESPVAPAADLGDLFHMREIARGGNYEGLWRRRGFSGFYDAYWIHVPTGQVLTDVIEVRGIEGGELVLHRRDAGGRYRAPVRADGSLATGSASWASRAAFRWTPLPAQDVRAVGQSLGAVVHLREVTPAGNYDAVWRRRGKTNVYDALWVHGPSGELVTDVVVVTGVRQGHVEIQRPKTRGLYRAPVQRDGRVQGGWAMHGGNRPQEWIVLPAQAVSLPAVAATEQPPVSSPVP